MKALLILILIGISPLVLHGQDDKAVVQSLLPDIDPQDIEIRGDFLSRFPGIMRQPILGFNPKPRVFQIDPNRMPFVESREQVAATLPMSELESLQAPVYTFIDFPKRYRVWSYSGIGNYTSPEAGLIAEIPLHNRVFLLSETRHESSSGHAPQPSAYRFTDTALKLVMEGRKQNRWMLYADGRSDFNYLNRYTDTGTVYTPINNLAELNGGLTWNKDRSAVHRSMVSVYGTYSESRISKDVSRSFYEEIRTGAQINHSWATNRPGQYMNLGVNTDHGFQSLVASSGNFGVTAVSLRFTSTLNLMKISVGSRAFFGYDPSNDGVIRVYPDIKLEYRRAGSFTLAGEVTGEVTNNGLNSFAKHNRFLRPNRSSLNESRLIIRGVARQEIYTGFRFEGGIEYNVYSRLGYYSTDAVVRNFIISYTDRASHMHIFGNASYDVVPEELTIYLSVNLNDGSIQGNSKLPNMELFSLDFGLNYHPTDRINISMWGDYIGKRYLQPNNVSASPWFALGARADYRFTTQFGAYLKGTNLINQSYSPWGIGYGAPPIQAFGGLTLKF